jgi:uncharacterized protein (DUF779 family)
MIKRIGATVEAIELIQTLKRKHGDNVLPSRRLL